MKERIGRGINRVDGPLKVTGQAKYVGDFREEGLLYGVIFQSTVAGGSIQSFNFTDARKVPGVVEFLTYQNAPRLKGPKNKMGGGAGESFWPLQNNKIYYNGQHIGLAVATTLEAATQAAALVKVTYAAAKPRLDFEHLQNTSYDISSMKGLGKINNARGNVRKAFASAPVKLDVAYTTPMENHNPMEPSGTLAIWRDGRLTVYDATQGVSPCAQVLADTFDLDHDKVEVIAKFIGGGFGCKGSVWGHQPLAVMAAMKTKKPVRVLLSRPQMFTGVGHRAQTLQKIKIGAAADGSFQSIEHVILNETALNKDFSERSGAGTGMLYHCENVKVEHRLVKTNFQAPTFMRAPGHSSGSFALECAVDEMAEKLKMDPIALRMKNYATEDGEKKKPFSSKSLDACYKQGAERFGWSRRKPEPRSLRDGDWYIGYGMATATYPAHIFPSSAQVDLLPDGSARVTSGTQDIGTGTYTAMTQISSECLGLPLDKIHFDLGTSKYAQAGVSGGSTTVSSVGTAIQAAAEDLRLQLAKIAIADARSPLHGQKVETLELKNGQLVKKGADKGDAYTEIMKRNGLEKVSALGEAKMNLAILEKYSTHAFGAQFAEVRVHRLTGEVRLNRLLGAFGSGDIINEKTARSQYQGGIIFGVGQALMEETLPDLRSGRLTVRDLADYHMPVQADIPEIDVLMIPEKDEHVNPIGTKGIGEIGIVGVAAAIANAVYNASGVRIRDLPLTPDKILMKG